MTEPGHPDGPVVDPRVEAAAARLTRPGGWNLWPADARRIAADVVATVDALTAEAIVDALHPEFGTEWREPDGVIWQAVHAVELERDAALAEAERLRTENAALIDDSAAWLLGYDAARVHFTAEAAAALDEAVQSAAVPVGYELVRIPEVDEVLEEDDPQCTCTHPTHHSGRCTNDADQGELCLPCIHGCEEPEERHWHPNDDYGPEIPS